MLVGWPVWFQGHSADEGPACRERGPAGAAPGRGCLAAGQSGNPGGEASGRAEGKCTAASDRQMFRFNKPLTFHHTRVKNGGASTDHLIHTHPPHTQRGSWKQAPNGKDFMHLRVFSTLHLEIHRNTYTNIIYIKIYWHILWKKYVQVKCVHLL